MKKLILYSWKGISRCKARSLTAVAGYSIAALVFGIIISLLLYSDKSLDNVLNNTGTHFISYKPLCCGLPYTDNSEANQNFTANGIPSQPLPVNMVDKIKKVPEVLDASPFLLYKLKDEKSGKHFLIGGFDIKNNIAVKSSSCSSTDITSGRFLNERDTAAVMAELSYALSNGLKIGSEITAAGIPLKIIGIINPGVRPAKADLYMLYETAEKIIGKNLNAPVNDLMNIVLVESLNAHSHNRAMTEVNKLMGDLSLISTYACFKPASGAMDINQNVLGLLLILITCLVVLFSFVNRYSSILERLHDFGILSAIGWSNFKIVSIIFFESLIQITAGGFISFFFLLLFINIMPLQDMINTNILFDMQTSFSVYVLGFMLVLVAAIIGIIFPALSMIKKLPSENLRILY